MSLPVNEKAEYGSDEGSGTGVAPEVFERPTGLKGLYYNPYTQVCMLGFVCFMCPGMFNAVNGLGGGGQLDKTTGSNSNVAVYSTFAVGAFFSGTINNVLGPRLTLLLGSTGYALYIGSYLALNIHPGAGSFVIASGAILGVCAGLLWTAQGSLMLAYPTEVQKGRFIGIFWAIFNLGAVIGSAVSFGTNFHSMAGKVANGTYIGFIVLTCIGVAIPMLMADPKKMVRTDGTRVVTVEQPSWKAELYGLYVCLRDDPWVLTLFPMFFASNFFYTWQFNDYNGALFNIRTRSLNGLIYYAAQILGSILIGLLLDTARLSRRFRAFSGWMVLLVLTMVVHGWSYHYQKDYTRADTGEDAVTIDFKDSKYPSRIWLYIFCGLLDAMWQTAAYWMMGAMSNNPTKLAYFTGFYKSIQSAGGAIGWRLDAIKTPYMTILAITWGLLIGGLLFMLPLMHTRIHEHTEETTAIVNGTEQVMRADKHSRGVVA